MENVIDQEKRQTEEEMAKEKALKENLMRMNMYAKHVKEMNLPKIEEGSPLPK
jgi:hypothetical protein